MTHWRKLTNPDYLGSYALEDGRDLILTIREVKQETVTGPEGKKEQCLVCHWQEDAKPMILNMTNAKMIEKLLKTPYLEQWPGHRVQIGSEKVRAFGETVDALRVRAFLPTEQVLRCEECGGEITGAYGMSAEELARYTSEKYGRQICAACAKEAAKK